MINGLDDLEIAMSVALGEETRNFYYASEFGIQAGARRV